MNNYQETIRPAYAVSDATSALLRSVYTWMTIGLFTTGFVATYVLYTPAITNTLLSPGLIMFLCLVELGLVFWLSARVMQMSTTKATTVFLLYSALNGITLAPLALVYTGESIASTFMITGGLFGTMAFYGQVTKRDLSGMGSFLMMGLIGVIIAAVVNMFMQSSALAFGISCVGVLVFTGLTAYDVNQIKRMGSQVSSGTDDFKRVTILGALKLYLDFINLFIMLLQLLGRRD